MLYKTITITIASKKLNAKIADNIRKRGKGLSRSPTLAHNGCMLFIFDHNAKHTLWMRGMKFPIDVLWLNEKKEIVDMMMNLKPATFFEFKTYSPKEDAKYVIELHAGFIEKNMVTTKSKIEL